MTGQPNSPSPARRPDLAGSPSSASSARPPGPARPQETLTAWARLLFGAERAGQIAPSLTERIGHLDQISRAGLGYDDEPATRYRPPGPPPEGHGP